MVLGIQLIGAIFGIAMVYLSVLHYKRHTLSVQESSIWLVIWTGVIILSLFPGLVDPFAQSLSFVRTFDFLAILGFVVLGTIYFVNYTRLRHLEQRLTALVQKLAHDQPSERKK